jgi:Domain of unknown function (DUF4261)
MPIRFSCANAKCNKRFQVADELAGRKARCPGCGEVQVIPMASQPAATPEAPPSYPGADSLTARFGGEAQDEGRRHRLPVANPQIEDPIALIVLFAELPHLATRPLTQAVRQFHPDMAKGAAEIEPGGTAQGTPYGLVGWGRHVIKLVGFDGPFPSASLERCVAPAHYGQDFKLQARSHRGHVILYYAGYESDPCEQYVALAAAAGALAAAGGLIVCNETACTSLPARVLRGSDAGDDRLELLRALPLLMLYCGFVKYDAPDGSVWMRTFGCEALGLPNLAFHAGGHDQGEMVFELFGNTLTYLKESGAQFKAGETMQLSDEFYARLRLPTKAEPFLDSRGPMFVFEPISAREINRRR